MMLYSIREKAKGWFAWVIVILISVPFALWGIGSYITPDANPEIALVDNVKISSYEFQNALQREQQLLESRSQNMDEKLLKQSVLDKLINSQSIINHLISQGYATSRATLNSNILQDKNFHDPKTGQFSEALFKQLLQRMGLGFEGFKKKLQDDLLIQQYTNGISQAGWVNKTEVETIVSLLKQKRAISYIVVDSAAFIATINPLEEEINNYYQSNKERYEVAEQVKVAYIEVSREKMAKSIDVTNEEAEKAYQDSLAKYTDPEKRQASHILISFDKDAGEAIKNKARSEIDGIFQKIKAGEDFSALAKEYSKDPGSAKNGGDLGLFGKGDMVPEFEKVTYALKVDEISEPFESPFGFHIIKLTSILPAKIQPLADVKAKIISEIQSDKAEKPYFQTTELLQTIAYEQPDSLAPAASETGMVVTESPLFSKTGGKGLFANKKLLTAIFNEKVLESGNNSDLIEITNGHSIVVRVIEKVPASIKPLKDVKESIAQTLINKGAVDKALELAKTLSKALSEQQDISQLLIDNKLQMLDKGLVERNDIAVDRVILQKAFSLPRVKDKPESVAFMKTAKQAVTLLVNKVENGSSDDEKFIAMIANNLNQSRGSLYANMSIMQARANSKVEINQQRLFNKQE